jgi:hypothetical protein
VLILYDKKIFLAKYKIHKKYSDFDADFESVGKVAI